mgnify:FL=1
MILFNGAAIYDPVAEKWLYTEELPLEAAAITRQVLEAFPDVRRRFSAQTAPMFPE